MPFARVAELREAGDWSGLLSFLSEVGRKKILSRRDLAYAYGQSLYHLGRMEELADFAPSFEEAARERSDTRGVMEALNLAGTARFELGRTTAAEACYAALQELAESEDDREMMARAANNLGMVATLRGDPAAGLTHYSFALPLYQRLGEARFLAQTHHNLGICYRDMRRLDDATREHREASDLARSLGYIFLVGMASSGRAEVELRRGDVFFARRLADRAVRLSREVGDRIGEAEARRVGALARARTDDRERAAALEEMEEARKLAVAGGSRLIEAEIERDRGAVLRQMGREEGAREHLARALELFEELGADGYAREVRRQLES